MLELVFPREAFVREANHGGENVIQIALSLKFHAPI